MNDRAAVLNEKRKKKTLLDVVVVVGERNVVSGLKRRQEIKNKPTKKRDHTFWAPRTDVYVPRMGRDGTVYPPEQFCFKTPLYISPALSVCSREGGGSL